MYDEYKGMWMVRQVLKAMAGDTEGKAGTEEKPEAFVQTVRRQRTYTKPRTQSRGQAINRKVKLVL